MEDTIKRDLKKFLTDPNKLFLSCSSEAIPIISLWPN